jgi:rhamnosyltransferase
MIYAAKVIENGYQIAYAADARVIHSHNYTGKQQFHRNFDLGVSQAEHPEVFEGISSESEGIHMVKTTIKELKEKVV